MKTITTINGLREDLCELKGQCSTSSDLKDAILCGQIDNILDIFIWIEKSFGSNSGTDAERLKKIIKKSNGTRNYVEMRKSRPTQLVDEQGYIEPMLEDLRNWKANEKSTIKQGAYIGVSKSKTKLIGVVGAVLLVIAIGAFVVGVLGVCKKMDQDLSDTLCNFIGTLDCVFGICFFVYEIFEDKKERAKIDAEDVKTIGKYVEKVTGSKSAKDAETNDDKYGKKGAGSKSAECNIAICSCLNGSYQNNGVVIPVNGEMKQFKDENSFKSYLESLFKE